jgi:hypothetical protein
MVRAGAVHSPGKRTMPVLDLVQAE